ncbi:MAG TPA: hypothetical protein VM888_06620 [Chitinophagaceae bacterium]|jgi:hypothetical protein|nr:hypothetical protein [Chitinophagaceae bacterium]
MMQLIKVLRVIFDWSEVWAPLIPLLFIVFKPKQPKHFQPIIIYLVLAVIIDLLIDISWKFKSHVPLWLQDNNFLYNIHSVIRFICFSIYFTLLNQSYNRKLQKIVPLLSIAFLLINFNGSEHFIEKNSFSSRLLAVEAGLLLFYCLQYFLYKLQQEQTIDRKAADYWIVLGLSIYVVFNFPYFLFYKTLLENGYRDFVVNMWHFHNVSYILLCILIAKAIYVAGNK